MSARLVASLGVAVAVAAIAPAAHASCGGVKRARPTHQRVAGRPPLVIGDSVVLGAVPQLASAGYEVNTRGCRQMSEGLDVIRARRHAGTLPHLVVIALGTNWTISRDEIRSALKIIGAGRVLGLVTPREEGGGSGSDAAVIRAEGRAHPNRIDVLDWVRFSAGHGGWFSGDGIHLGPSGARGLARLLSRALPLAAPAPCALV